MLLENRVALVTGASRGIGAATARLLGRHGAAVGVNYLSSDVKAGEVVAGIEEAGGRAIAVQGDVREADQVERMIGAVRDGLGPVDVLILNASVSFEVKPFLSMEWEDFEPKLTGELKAAFHCVRAVAPSMIEREAGTVVAVSSTLSRHPAEGFASHSAAKSGLDAFMKSLALELGPKGIRVNVVAPGLTLTDATAWLPDEQKDFFARTTPLRRNALPEDIAGVILAMACDETRFVNGAYVPVSGGQLML